MHDDDDVDSMRLSSPHISIAIEDKVLAAASGLSAIVSGPINDTEDLYRRIRSLQREVGDLSEEVALVTVVSVVAAIFGIMAWLALVLHA